MTLGELLNILLVFFTQTLKVQTVFSITIFLLLGFWKFVIFFKPSSTLYYKKELHSFY